MQNQEMMVEVNDTVLIFNVNGENKEKYKILPNYIEYKRVSMGGAYYGAKTKAEKVSDANPDEGTISQDTPIAQCLLGKKVGEFVQYKNSKGDTFIYRILDIEKGEGKFSVDIGEAIEYKHFKVTGECLNSILGEHYNHFVIISLGSCDTYHQTGNYKALIKYMDQVEIVSEKIEPIRSVNQCALYGFLVMVRKISKPSKVVFISPIELGFKKALRSNGTNKDTIQLIFDSLIEHQCTLNFYMYDGGAEPLKKYCKENGLVETKSIEKSKEYVFKKDKITWNVCIDEVLTILESHAVDGETVDIIRKMKDK